jgi:hypothetical protein
MFNVGDKVVCVDSSMQLHTVEELRRDVPNWVKQGQQYTIRDIVDSDFVVGETIRSNSSGSSAIIESIINFDSYYDVDSSSVVKSGWQKETGFLDNNLQKIQDSDYYQYFSYSLKESTCI